MKIEKRQEGSNLTVLLEGRLDTNTAPELEDELSSLDGINNLVFDFQNLEYISSAGLRIILSLQKIMSTKGTMVIRNVNDDVKEVFDITGFSDVLTIE